MKAGWREQAEAIADPFARKMFVMGVVEGALRARGVRPVVVGGMAVEWHSRGLYQSADIDILCPDAPLGEVMRELGFSKEGRHWYDEGMEVVLEAPGSSLEAYRDRTITVETPGGRVTMVSVEESILDRLRACVDWKSALDGEQALHMMVVQQENIDWAYLEHQAIRDQFVEKLAETRKRAEGLVS